jgi:outer membrane lipoprotein-sorting protein
MAYASDETRQILRSFENITADYSLETYNNKHQIAFKDHGTLYVKNINELKLSSAVNAGSFVMLKDNYIWQYDHDLLQLIQIDLAHKKPTALSLLEHINDYTQKKVTTNDGYYLYLSHATMPNLKLHTRNNMLTSIEFYDSFDYMNKLLFANILSDIKLSKNTFVFIPSNDVEIIKQ